MMGWSGNPVTTPFMVGGQPCRLTLVWPNGHIDEVTHGPWLYNRTVYVPVDYAFCDGCGIDVFQNPGVKVQYTSLRLQQQYPTSTMRLLCDCGTLMAVEVALDLS